MLDKSHKEQIIADFRLNEKDTGSAEVQIAICTARITELTEHLKQHHKDNHTKFGLLKIVSRRRRLLNYVKSRCANKYKELTTRLEIKR